MKIKGVLLPANNNGDGGHISITDLMVPAAGVPVLIKNVAHEPLYDLRESASEQEMSRK